MQKKKITVVFYPDTARIFKGEYVHTGSEPFIVNPKTMPIGVPLCKWYLENGVIKHGDEKPALVTPEAVVAKPTLLQKVYTYILNHA